MMPVANKYNIKELLDACKYYSRITNRRITFEYALVNGINDSAKNAEELFNQLKGILCHVNLIPVNEIKENDYKRSRAKNIEEFKNILIKYGIETTIRREMGSDINGACGQLRRNYIKNN